MHHGNNIRYEHEFMRVRRREKFRHLIRLHKIWMLKGCGNFPSGNWEKILCVEALSQAMSGKARLKASLESDFEFGLPII